MAIIVINTQEVLTTVLMISKLCELIRIENQQQSKKNASLHLSETQSNLSSATERKAPTRKVYKRSLSATMWDDQ